jgi:hypothetical protein
MTTGFGLDLGAGLTKLACVSPGQTRAVPPRVIPTAIGYRGAAARILDRADGGPGEARYDGFPALLGDGSADLGGRSPAEVTREFLRFLLDDAGRSNAARSDATALPIAMAIPPGPAGAELEAIFSALGRPSARMLATPAAVLLYLRDSHPDLASASNFIVCDLGAAAVTLSVCVITGSRLRVLAFSQVFSVPFGPAGTHDHVDAGERRPFLIESLASALSGEEPADRATRVRRWRELEKALADDEQRERLDAVLEQALADSTRYSGTVALRIGNVTVTAATLLRACTPIADRCATELTRLLRRQRDPAWLRPGESTRVVLTGGLSTLRPVRAALLSAAGLDPVAPGPGAVVLDGAEALCAPAFGAALVAAGLAEPGDRYPHGLRLPVHRQVRDQLIPGYLNLAAAASIEVDLGEPKFATEPGDKAGVRVPAAASVGSAMPVEVVLAGSGTVRPAAFDPGEPPPPGRYHVGVCGHPNGAAIVLRPAGGGDLMSYPLAPLDAAPQQEGGNGGS